MRSKVFRWTWRCRQIPWFKVDEQLLSQAIINLVKNAAESLQSSLADHSLATGCVEVRVFVDPDDEDASIKVRALKCRTMEQGIRLICCQS